MQPNFLGPVPKHAMLSFSVRWRGAHLTGITPIAFSRLGVCMPKTNSRQNWVKNLKTKRNRGFANCVSLVHVSTIMIMNCVGRFNIIYVHITLVKIEY